MWVRVQLQSLKQKVHFENTRYLKDTNIYIYEDFSKETMAMCKGLWDKVKKSRQQSKVTVIKYDKIYLSKFRTRRSVNCVFFIVFCINRLKLWIWHLRHSKISKTYVLTLLILIIFFIWVILQTRMSISSIQHPKKKLHILVLVTFLNITVELNSSEKDAFSILHLNIRCLNKNFENLKIFLAWLGFQF